MAIVVTSGSYNMSIGERIELSVAVTQSSATLTDYRWELPMQYILENYEGPEYDFQRGRKVPFKESNLKASAVTFCWADDGEYEIRVNYKMDGADKMDRIRFKVHRPNVQNYRGTSAGAANAVVVEPGDWCGLRGPLSAPSGTRGFVWTATVHRASAERGRIGFIQLIDINRSRPPKADLISGGFVLDGAANKSCIFYGDWRGTKALNDRPVTLLTSDTPRSRCKGVTAHLQDKFKTYLMYKSERPGSIWAPLGRLNWEWEAKFKRNSATDPWAVDGSPSMTEAPAGVYPVSEFPEWTRYAPDL